jgi:hypothetical protein
MLNRACTLFYPSVHEALAIRPMQAMDFVAFVARKRRFETDPKSQPNDSSQ